MTLYHFHYTCKIRDISIGKIQILVLIKEIKEQNIANLIVPPVLYKKIWHLTFE